MRRPFAFLKNKNSYILVTFIAITALVVFLNTPFARNSFEGLRRLFASTSSFPEPPTPSVTKSYYVDCASGNDASTTPTNINTPWKTISKANTAQLAAGEGIFFKRGTTCVGTISARWTGTATSPIVIGAYGEGEKPLIQADGQHRKRASIATVNVIGRYQVIENLRITIINPYREQRCTDQFGNKTGMGFYNGVHISGHNNTIQKNEIFGPLAGGISLSDEASYNKVLHNHIHDLTSLWQLWGDYSRTTDANGNPIIDETQKDDYFRAVGQEMGYSVLNKGGSLGAIGINLHGVHGEFAYNLLENNKASCALSVLDRTTPAYSAPFEVFHASYNNVHHNKAFNHRKHFEMGRWGANPNSPPTDRNVLAYNLFVSDEIKAKGPNIHNSNQFGPITNTKVYNNTIVFTGKDSEAVIASGPNTELKNNIFVAEWKSAFIGSAAAPETNNIFWRIGGSPLVQICTASGCSNNNPIHATSKKADPGFVNLEIVNEEIIYRTLNLQLRSNTSPAVNAGVIHAYTSADITNSAVPDPTSTRIDIGAYEFNTVPLITVIPPTATPTRINTPTLIPSVITTTPVPPAQINRTYSAPVIDGNADSVWSSAPAIGVNNVIMGTVSSSSDLSGTFKTLWDTSDLYLYVDVTDDQKINDSGTTWWEDDVVQIFFDADNSKSATFGSDDFHWQFRWNDPEVHLSKGRTTGITFTQIDTATGYKMEIKIPWSTLGRTPSANMSVGLEVELSDDDDGGNTREGKKSWYGNTEHGAASNPSIWGTAQLQNSPSPTPTRAATPTPTRTATATPTRVPTATNTPTPTYTPLPTATNTPTPTRTPTPTIVPPSAPINERLVICIDTPTASGNLIRISWTNNANAISWMDISERSDFINGNFWHKRVTASVSTTAPEGFTHNNDNSQFTVVPNTVYYVRGWNGKHGAYSSFMMPQCPSPTPTATPTHTPSPTATATPTFTPTPTNVPPQITLISPRNAQYITVPVWLPIEATASDSDGTINRVEFYKNDSLVHTEFSAPFTHTTRQTEAGDVTIRVVAYDNTETSISTSVVVNFVNPPTATPTLIPTVTPTPTITPSPTMTPSPTNTPTPTEIPIPTPVIVNTIADYDDRTVGTGLNQFNYIGNGWRSCTLDTNSRCGSDLFNDSNSWSGKTGDSMTYTFTGNRLMLYAVKDTHHGIVSISIDDQTPTNVDLYNPTRQGNALVFTSPLLSSGTHTLTYRVTGTKNALSKGVVGTIDHVVVSIPTTVIDDRIVGTGNNQLNYVGTGWRNCSLLTNSNCGIGLYNDTNTWSGRTNDTATLSFSGTEIDLYAVKDTHHGILSISIDGQSEVTVDLYSPTRQGNTRVWSSPTLAPGDHTIQIRITGSKNVSSSGVVGTIDRIEVR